MFSVKLAKVCSLSGSRECPVRQVAVQRMFLTLSGGLVKTEQVISFSLKELSF